MIAWMLYGVLVALIVAAAARAAEWLARLVGYRVRWIWVGALALTALLSGTAALREVRSVVLPATVAPELDLGGAARAAADASWRRALHSGVENVRRSLDAPLRRAVATVHRVVPPVANVYAASLATTMSVGLVLVVVGIGRRFQRARREWPLVTLQGVEVRVAPRIGPVVIGLVHPEIIVPRWLLTRHAGEQLMVVTHEDEHVRARDPLLLGLAWSAVVAAPWNPVVWYMLSRLRLAVELDCDARVLRRGAAPRSYGALLIDVAQHASALRLSALALADDSSHLHQRILAMKPNAPRFARLRSGLAAVFAVAGLLVACQATLPTDAEIEHMDVADATRTARELAKAKHADTSVAYTVDGRTVSTADAAALAADAIDKVEIVTGPLGAPTRINIQRRKRPFTTASGDSDRVQRTALTREGTARQTDTVSALTPLATTNKAPFTGLVFIDGVRSTMSQVKALDQRQIESVEVLKGAYAAQEYGDPEAAQGVIVIKTKRGGGTK
jgi:hypothetical protein